MHMSFAHSSLKAFWSDEQGFVISAELVLVGTICVLGLITGLSSLQSAIVFELNDMSRAFCSLNHSFNIPGFRGCKGAFVTGSGFVNQFNCQNCQFIATNFGGVGFGGNGIGVTGGGFGGGFGGVGIGGGGFGGGVSVGVGGASSRPATIRAPRAATPVCPATPAGTPCPADCPAGSACPNNNCPTGNCPPAVAPLNAPAATPGYSVPQQPQYTPAAPTGPVIPVPGAPAYYTPST